MKLDNPDTCWPTDDHIQRVGRYSYKVQLPFFILSYQGPYCIVSMLLLPACKGTQFNDFNNLAHDQASHLGVLQLAIWLPRYIVVGYWPKKYRTAA